MYKLVVELKDFSAAHRLLKGYHGKCNHLHGHNYSLRVVLGSSNLDQNDLVIDFSVVRKVCNAWVQNSLDHCTLVFCEDLPLVSFLQREQQKHYVLSGNTTVECLAKEIYCNLSAIITNECAIDKAHCYLYQVELWESAGCGVIYSEKSPKLKGSICGE